MNNLMAAAPPHTHAGQTEWMIGKWAAYVALQYIDWDYNLSSPLKGMVFNLLLLGMALGLSSYLKVSIEACCFQEVDIII